MKRWKKPQVNVQMFAANDAIGACWTMTWNNGADSEVLTEDPTEEYRDSDNFHYDETGSNQGWWYDGDAIAIWHWLYSHYSYRRTTKAVYTENGQARPNHS